MRVIILSIVVVCCAVAYGQVGIPGGLFDLEESRWDEVKSVLQRSLLQLANEQGHHLKLSKFNNVQYQVSTGFKYHADAEFENNVGEKLNCHFTLWVQEWINFDELKLNCAEKEYVVTRGTKAT